MSGLEISILMILLTFGGILFGIHIGVSLIFFSVVGILLVTGDFGIIGGMLGDAPFSVLFDYELCVIPLFVLMGDFIIMAGAGQDLYRAFYVILKKVRGGLAIATVFANAVFAAVTGVSIASAAVFSKVVYPEMTKFGYEKKFIMGTIAGSSVLGMLIPPSVLFIVFGIFSEESIGKLFMAGVIPGLLLTVIYCIGISIMVRFRPQLAGAPVITEEEGEEKGFSPKISVLGLLKDTSGIAALIVVVLGGMYAGFLTPTEAGAAGAIGACILAMVKGRFKISSLHSALRETGLVVASFFILFIGAQLFSRMLAVSGFARALTETMLGLSLPPICILLMMVVVWLILGTLIDSISIMILTLPLMLPIVKALGFDLLWFGVIATITIEMGLITPPFGMVPFVMKSTLGKEVEIYQIFRGVLPFLLMMCICLALLIAFPQISTWLPSHVLG
jgi:tripartite ATP-independent transporter DctM subunit